MSDRLRLFVAADVPAAQRAELARIMTPWRASLPEARWADPAGQHVTLKFLGWADADVLTDIVGVAATAAAARRPAAVRLAGFGAFPGRTRMRVLWVGIDDPDEVLTGLAGELARGFVPLGFEPEARAFHPHLTLARWRVPRRFPDDLSDDVVEHFPPFLIDRVVLYRSHLSPKGARYEPVRSLPVGAGGVGTG